MTIKSKVYCIMIVYIIHLVRPMQTVQQNLDPEKRLELFKEIKQWKEKRKAVIIAHNYQIPDIQDIADYVGDSLELARKAATTDADVIVFCGVHFMAESAAIFSPD